jgi:hypothetical protein
MFLDSLKWKYNISLILNAAKIKTATQQIKGGAFYQLNKVNSGIFNFPAIVPAW